MQGGAFERCGVTQMVCKDDICAVGEAAGFSVVSHSSIKRGKSGKCEGGKGDRGDLGSNSKHRKSGVFFSGSFRVVANGRAHSTFRNGIAR